MKSTPSADDDYQREAPATEKSSEHSWNYFPKWTDSISWAKSKLSWPPTDRIHWIPHCFDQVRSLDLSMNLYLFSGRLDRKIEIGLPNEASRLDILKIHSKKITKAGDINLEAVAKICDEFNGADLRNVCTESGMFAIRNDREYVIEEDFMQAARKIKETKKLETKIDYAKV